MQWNIQASSITTNLKVKIYFTLTRLSAKTPVTWNCHVYDSSRGIYDMILGRDILTDLGSNLKLYDNVIKANDGPFKRSTAPMVDLG